ncbi:unnamed protein product, partial [Amoebophrya sp. A25]|eukprot:GSA25T00000835001.1
MLKDTHAEDEDAKVVILPSEDTYNITAGRLGRNHSIATTSIAEEQESVPTSGLAATAATTSL